jgi:hypothetical protein
VTTTTSYDHLYLCELCGRFWVVPSLARACEDKHLEAESYCAGEDPAVEVGSRKVS